MNHHTARVDDLVATFVFCERNTLYPIQSGRAPLLKMCSCVLVTPLTGIRVQIWAAIGEYVRFESEFQLSNIENKQSAQLDMVRFQLLAKWLSCISLEPKIKPLPSTTARSVLRPARKQPQNTHALAPCTCFAMTHTQALLVPGLVKRPMIFLVLSGIEQTIS